MQVGRVSRVGDAISGITRHMRKHELRPGDKLPSESMLAKELNVSRATVREAFQSLATMRIIELATGKRATVTQIDHGALSLMIEHGDRDDDLWVYLPALKKVRRLAASNKKDSFVGTDFSYGDMIGYKIDDWTHRLLREETVDGAQCYVIESIPKTDAGKSRKKMLKDAYLKATSEHKTVSMSKL